jgi:hypothetical protein
VLFHTSFKNALAFGEGTGEGTGAAAAPSVAGRDLRGRICEGGGAGRVISEAMLNARTRASKIKLLYGAIALLDRRAIDMTNLRK